MKKLLLTIISAVLLGLTMYSQAPSNDNCVSATSLTVNGTLLCVNTASATTQSGEQCASYNGQTNRTIWFSFVATSTTMVLNILKTNITNLPGVLSVYGPNVTCVPGAAQQILGCTILNGDPGYYPQLTGLTVGATYLVQYNGSDGGGSNSRVHNICIGVYNEATNNTATNATQINQCGFVYNGTTLGGYSATGTGTRRANFDGTGGDDVPWVGNNDSWFYFCAGAEGTYNITFNVGTCVFSPPNAGGQMSILTGSPSIGFTNIGNSTNPTASGSSWTSSNFTLTTGQCVYLVVDGFAGDACNYSYTLTNVSGGCILLNNKTNLSGKVFSDRVSLSWDNIDGIYRDYSLERSLDGVNFSEIVVVSSASQKNNFNDLIIPNTVSTLYYRLSTIENELKSFSSVFVANLKNNKKIKSTKIFDVFGKEYSENNLPSGVVIYVIEFENGHMETKKE
jgi:hypothetical protein